ILVMIGDGLVDIDMDIVFQKVSDNLRVRIGRGVNKCRVDSGLHKFIERVRSPRDAIAFRDLGQSLPVACAQKQFDAALGSEDRKVGLPANVANTNYADFHLSCIPEFRDVQGREDSEKLPKGRRLNLSD